MTLASCCRVTSGQPVGQRRTGAVLVGERLSTIRRHTALKKETANTSNTRASRGERVDLRKIGKFSYRCVLFRQILLAYESK